MGEPITRSAAKEALEQAKATLEIPALYFQEQGDSQSQAILGMLMAAGLIISDIERGFTSGQL